MNKLENKREREKETVALMIRLYCKKKHGTKKKIVLIAKHFYSMPNCVVISVPLHVSRQTISKWELGDSTLDMEKLIGISDFFEISLDELVKDQVPDQMSEKSIPSETVKEIKEKVFSPENKKWMKKILKITAIILGTFVIVDLISLIVYISLYGFPK